MKKRYLWLLLALPFIFHLFSLFFLHFNENFSASDFEHGFKENYATKISELDFETLDTALNQHFQYLGHGKQMVAFESSDGKYVLKLFNPMRPQKKGWYKQLKFWKRYSSLNWISREWFQKDQRLKKLFTRHQLAYEYLKDETGLVFVHLNPSKRVCHYIHATDNRGQIQILDLNKTPFVLQEKAILVPQYLQSLLHENKREEANLAVAKLLTLFEKRLEVGITDRIQTMGNNYGFVGTRPIQIDVGRIRFDPDLLEKPEMERARILNNFHIWLIQKFPELDP